MYECQNARPHAFTAATAATTLLRVNPTLQHCCASYMKNVCCALRACVCVCVCVCVCARVCVKEIECCMPDPPKRSLDSHAAECQDPQTKFYVRPPPEEVF